MNESEVRTTILVVGVTGPQVLLGISLVQSTSGEPKIEPSFTPVKRTSNRLVPGEVTERVDLTRSIRGRTRSLDSLLPKKDDSCPDPLTHTGRRFPVRGGESLDKTGDKRKGTKKRITSTVLGVRQYRLNTGGGYLDFILLLLARTKVNSSRVTQDHGSM